MSALPAPWDPRVLVGTSHADDAGVFRISADEALIATVDFFTPIVDDPYVYGAIAAANSLSDVYAMGGDPLFALAIAAFPQEDRVLPLFSDVMAGAADKAKEAGICIIGGHTVKDKEPKFGLSVTGTVHPDRIWTNRGARPGDAVYLTKPLGTGVITSAIKWEIAPRESAEAAVASMSRLNAGAARAGRAAGVHTATDVTGFGLLGHLIEVMEGSGTAARIRIADLPLFPGVRELMRTRVIPKLVPRLSPNGALGFAHRAFGFSPIPAGARENIAFQRAKARFPAGLPAEDELLLADPQTSGGLLFFVPPEREALLRDRLAAEGEGVWRIGTVEARTAPGDPAVAVDP